MCCDSEWEPDVPASSTMGADRPRQQQQFRSRFTPDHPDSKVDTFLVPDSKVDTFGGVGSIGCCKSSAFVEHFIQASSDENGCVVFLKIQSEGIQTTGCEPKHPETNCTHDTSNRNHLNIDDESCTLYWKTGIYSDMGACNCVGQGTNLSGGQQIARITIEPNPHIGSCLKCTDMQEILDYAIAQGWVDTYVPQPERCCNPVSAAKGGSRMGGY